MKGSNAGTKQELRKAHSHLIVGPVGEFAGPELLTVGR